MKTIGFINSHKESEKRIALLPKDLDGLSDIASAVYFEDHYGEQLGIPNEEYTKMNAQIESREYILKHCDIICDVKVGDAEYLNELPNGRIIFGWVHTHMSSDLKPLLLKKQFSVYAWEEMMDNGMHVFYRNNELAGEAAVLHAAECSGMLLKGKKAAVIGRGNTAVGAIRALVCNGADVTIYGRNQEEKFRQDLSQYDILVNAVLWDLKRTDHIIYRQSLSKMKRNALLIDVGCVKNGAVETCTPTDFNNPIYIMDSVIHYCVDHTPTLYYRSASEFISMEVKRFIRPLVMGNTDSVLESGHVIECGKMLLPETSR